MLQKSGSKTVSKFRHLILAPLMLAMLTYVSYSQETVKNPEENVLSEPAEVQIPMTTKAQDSTDVPFAIVEEVPIFPGCERLGSNRLRKDCMTERVTRHVNGHFNTSLGKELELEGVNQIYVQFKITRDGNIEILSTRAPHPALEAEAERVVNMLPEMIPGKQKGKVVAVLYSLPITFRVSE